MPSPNKLESSALARNALVALFPTSFELDNDPIGRQWRRTQIYQIVPIYETGINVIFYV